jgi:dethiobiotin synthetase
MAAEHQGLIISQQDLLDWCRSRLRPGVAFEGIGGLLVPICEGYRVADLIRDLSILPVLVTRTSLGTINATLLSVHAMRSAGITPVAVIASHTSNAPDGSWLRASGHIEDSIYPIPLIELPSVEWDAPPTQEEATALASLADVLKRGGR